MKYIDLNSEEKYYKSLIKPGTKPKQKPPVGFEYTGEYICHSCTSHGYPMITVHAVIKGKYTPCGYLRDCGDHYIRGWYQEYDRIEKETFKITTNVQDE